MIKELSGAIKRHNEVLSELLGTVDVNSNMEEVAAQLIKHLDTFITELKKIQTNNLH